MSNGFNPPVWKNREKFLIPPSNDVDEREEQEIESVQGKELGAQLIAEHEETKTPVVRFGTRYGHYTPYEIIKHGDEEEVYICRCVCGEVHDVLSPDELSIPYPVCSHGARDGIVVSDSVEVSRRCLDKYTSLLRAHNADEEFSLLDNFAIWWNKHAAQGKTPFVLNTHRPISRDNLLFVSPNQIPAYQILNSIECKIKEGHSLLSQGLKLGMSAKQLNKLFTSSKVRENARVMENILLGIEIDARLS
ncbi:hypothetical protein [Vibrio phage CAU_VPP01]|nr:hypothetical protein [Vibrio phage CAU_VPP01]